eukprot:498148_1
MSSISEIDKCIEWLDTINNIDEIKNINLPYESKRAIAATHLLATILREYLNDKKHLCPFIKNKNENTNVLLLDCIFIRGGALRDILLNRSINDVDCCVLLEKSIQLQLDHLKQYHSKKEQQGIDCQCIIWKHYLHKFVSNNHNNILMQYMHKIVLHDDHKSINCNKHVLQSLQHRIILAEYIINTR